MIDCLVLKIIKITSTNTTIALLLLSASLTSAAQELCRVEPLGKDDAEKLTWTGSCKDGLADGKGVIEAKAEDWKGWRYEGQVQRGRPHGHGYMKMEDGREYEGEYADGRLEGMGIYLSPFGDRYDGNFKAGRRDGRGSMSFALGGR